MRAKRLPDLGAANRGLNSDSQVSTHLGLALLVHIGDALMDSAVEMIGVDEGLVSK